jgi:serine/threonine protein kinase
MEEMEGLDELRLIGAGGFADVYEARELAFGRNVAVKVFRLQLDDRTRRSFERESQAMGRLSGIRNVVQVHRSGITADGRPFLVMELMNGSLEDLLATGPLSPGQACGAGAVLGRALGDAHARGVLHRDIKPANILIDRYGEPTLSDFGISSLNDLAASVEVRAFTAEHAAPELFTDARSSEASDVYSLASTIYTMLEGRAPFERAEGEGPLVFMRRVSETPCPPSAVAASVSPDLDDLLMRALAKRPEDRPTVEELVSGLGRWASASPLALGETTASAIASTGPPTAPPPQDPPATAEDPDRGSRSTQGQRRRVLAAAVTLLIVVVGAAVLLARASTDSEDDASADVTTSSSSTTTSSVSTATPPPRTPGVTNARPSDDPELTDTSGLLRARLNAFAGASTVPAVQAGPKDEPDGVDLKFGVPPAVFDYAASNDSTTSECLKLYLDDVTVQGAAAAVWFEGEQLVLVNAVQMASELQARQYYWSTTMFLGLRDEHCDGWPANQVAVNPTDLTVDRTDFEISTDPDDLYTMIDDSPQVAVIKAGIAYQAVLRIDDVVVVVSVVWAQGAPGAGPAEAATIVDGVVSAFSNP